ncbi:tyrosine-type recombinase/integrase [Sphaerotilus sp.]|uniref:tyrosine-type recombinase/integrase n=1 Tax=Sphaerotilus sp. TaxID=2093942 RepID=UPI002ACD2362|nr:hypothetical protein [Sphaerotilus sp.]MDZ7858176.1 hypothetical protein [Sphaerotilus sp.]
MLTDPACRNATCPTDKLRTRLADAGGLYLDVSLKAARDGRDRARKTRDAGTDPVQARRVEKAISSASTATTFELVAREFHATKVDGWSENHAAQWLRCSEKDLFPWIGALPLADVSAPLLLDTLRKVEARGALLRDIDGYAGQPLTRAALRRMGYGNEDMTAHGFRAMARTLIIERLPGISPDVIEAQLAHGKSVPLGMAHDRAEFMEQRRQMMQTWAD